MLGFRTCSLGLNIMKITQPMMRRITAQALPFEMSIPGILNILSASGSAQAKKK